MKAQDYIFAKHPDGGVNYPAKVDRVTAKFVHYTDDDGRKVKVSKLSCRIQMENSYEHKRIIHRIWHSQATQGVPKVA